MLAKDIECEKCGCDMFEAAKRGAYFKRLNKGELPAKYVCAPGCDSEGTQEDALLAAVEDGENSLKGESV